MVNIIILRSNSIVNNPRVRKIARSLSKEYDLTVLGWNREGIRYENMRFSHELVLLNIRAPYGRKSIISYFPLYWIWVLIKLMVYRPRVIHACDLDSAIPCYVYKIFSGAKLVFDVCDRYAMTYISPQNRILYRAVTWLEESVAAHSDALINVSEKLLNSFRRRPKYCPVIMNCSEMKSTEPLKRTKKDLTLVYTGNIINNRGLEQVGEAIRNLTGIEFVIAGRPIDVGLLYNLRKLNNVSYRGYMSQDDALSLVSSCDVVVALYDPSDPISPYSMGNKVFEAMMNGKPVIANVASEIIDAIECGIIVDYNNLDELRAAIEKLRDDHHEYERLSKNGYNACLTRYNWSHMESKLLELYKILFKPE